MLIYQNILRFLYLFLAWTFLELFRSVFKYSLNILKASIFWFSLLAIACLEVERSFYLLYRLIDTSKEKQIQKWALKVYCPKLNCNNALSKNQKFWTQRSRRMLSFHIFFCGGLLRLWESQSKTKIKWKMFYQIELAIWLINGRCS